MKDDLYELIKRLFQFIYKKLGLTGLIALAVVVLASVVCYLIYVGSPQPLRDFAVFEIARARPYERLDEFTVGVARLDNDADGEGEQFIEDALVDVNGLKVRSLEPVLRTGDSQQIEKSTGEAIELLKSTNCDLLIWGEVLGRESEASLKLRFVALDVGSWQDSPLRLQLEDSLTFPLKFKKELAPILKAIIAARASSSLVHRYDMSAEQDRTWVQILKSFNAGEIPQTYWTESDRANLQFVLALSLQILGYEAEDSGSLRDAVQIYRALLFQFQGRPRETAIIYANLGVALRNLGELTENLDSSTESISALSEALKMQKASGLFSPLEIATAKVALAGAELQAVEMGGSSATLDQTTNLIEEALAEEKRGAPTVEEGGAYSDLCVAEAMTALNSRPENSSLLEMALGNCQTALRIVDQHYPNARRDFLINFGTASKELGLAKGDPALFRQSADVYRDVASFSSKQLRPIEWAHAEAQRCVVLTLGFLSPRGGKGEFADAEDVCSSTLADIPEGDRFGTDRALVQSSLGIFAGMHGAYDDSNAQEVCDAVGIEVKSWKACSSDALRPRATACSRMTARLALIIAPLVPYLGDSRCLDGYQSTLDEMRRWLAANPDSPG